MRGWTLAVCSATLAIAAHGMAGGEAPDTALAVLLTMIVAWGGTAVADRGRGPLAMPAALGMSQLAMHLVLNYSVASHVGHCAAPVDPTTMLLAHVAATVLTGLLLARADDALRVVTSAIWLLRDLLKSPRFPVVRGATSVLLTSPTHGDHMLKVVLRRVCARRGPPVRS
jgi:hypothetical protein